MPNGGPVSNSARKVVSGSTLPSSPHIGQVFVKTGAAPGLYSASAEGVWTGPYGTGAGTVTSVSGTANQIDVATGTTTPVLSFPTNGIIANNISPGLLSTATAAGTTTLTVASKGIQVFTGSTTQTIVLPVVTTLPQLGVGFVIQNDSSGALTVNSSGGNLVQTMAAGTRAFFTCKLLTGTDAASWNVTYLAGGTIGGSGTLNTLTKFTPDGTHIGDSQVTEVGSGAFGSLALDRESNLPDSSLQALYGFLQFGDTSVSGGLIIDNSGTPLITLGSPSTPRLKIQSSNSSIEVDSGAGTTTIGDVNGERNGTFLTVNDAAQTISNVTVLWEAGAGGTEFRINGDGFISRYGDSALTNGQILIGGAASGALAAATLTPGTGISVTNGDGSITIAADNTNRGAILTCLSNNTVLSTATGQVFTSPGNDGTPLTVTSEGAVGWVVTRAGTVRNLYVRTGTTAKVNTPATAIVVRKNGVDTALTIAAMTQTTTTNSSDTTHSFTVTAGDVITVSLTTTGVAGVSTSIASITFEID